MAQNSDKRQGPDLNSIRMTTMLSFVLFALFLLAILWGLSNFFLNAYYERARTQEVVQLAEGLTAEYRENREEFDDYAVDIAESNDIYIRLDAGHEQLEYDGTRSARDSDLFSTDIELIRRNLEYSGKKKANEVKMTPPSGSGNSRLVYASKIKGLEGPCTLYIIAPLHPDEVTIRILRDMLLYISSLVLLMSFLLAYALSKRLSSPIANLTESATELSKGNYDVHFDGASFTETKKLARALNKASYEMERTDFYQREIIANVSHDLKTPLTMIRSYAEKIMDISGDDKKKRDADLNVIISETERLNRLVSDMLSISNLQSNNVEMHMETFDLVEAAKDVYESFQVLADSEGYEIEFKPCKPAYVVGDRTRLMQVMTNFVSNAVKYSGDNKYVNIKLSKGNKKVSFHCIDKGIGIPSDEISHVWDKYYRTSANHERDIEGTGLGLAIVKGLLNLHNAKYGVDSEEGKGSDFWFELDTVRKPSERKKDGKEG